MVYHLLLNTYSGFLKTKKRVRTGYKIKLGIYFNAAPIDLQHAGRIGRVLLMGQLFLGYKLPSGHEQRKRLCSSNH